MELRPFNDRELNRDLEAICAQINAEETRLPDGRATHVLLEAQNTVERWLVYRRDVAIPSRDLVASRAEVSAPR